jgi:hypothetical protein
LGTAEEYLRSLKAELEGNAVQVKPHGERVEFRHGNRTWTAEVPLHLLSADPGKIKWIVLSKLRLNRTVFARKCALRRITKEEGDDFLMRYHLMGSTTCAFIYGLFLDKELLCVGTFSKGRKMDRLPGHLRSYELIRFCTKGGITVSGGLTRIVKNFCRERSAGDIMTYVDAKFSDGSSFLRSGFVIAQEQKNARVKGKGADNIKMIFSCEK